MRANRIPFLVALQNARLANASRLCIGLDPEPERLPLHLDGAANIERFCLEIIEATSDVVCAYKPNTAFFERLGADGWQVLQRVMAAIPRDVPVIVDGKRGDIGNTSRAYAEAMFDSLGASACTVSPYLGVDAIKPLLEHNGGFCFVLCRTSNPGAGTFQDLVVDGMPLHAIVVREFQPYVQAGVAGFVIGNQAAEAFAWAARVSPEAAILSPGLGAQGGTAATLAAVVKTSQVENLLASASRSIIHASTERDYALKAREAAVRLRDELDATFMLQKRTVSELANS